MAIALRSSKAGGGAIWAKREGVMECLLEEREKNEERKGFGFRFFRLLPRHPVTPSHP